MSRIRNARLLAGTALLALGAAACVPETPAPTTVVPETTTTLPTETTTTLAPTTTVAPTTTIATPVFTPAATFTATTDLAQVGSTVTVTGSGFDPSKLTPQGTPANQAVAGVYVAIGTGNGPVPTSYTSAKYIRPSGPEVETASGARLNADGTFSATIATPPVFAGQGQAVNCYLEACKVFVWSAHTGTVPEWTFSSAVSFAAPTTPQVAVSKAANIANAGETVTVKGVGFAAESPGIYVGQVPWTAATAPAGWNLDASKWGDTKFLPFGTFGAHGSFTTTIAVAATIGADSANCAVTPAACSIATVRAHGRPDLTPSQTVFTPVSLVAAPAA